MNKFAALTGREIIIAVELDPTPENKAAFTQAIFEGKFSGMTQKCIENIREQAHRLVAQAA